MSITEWNPTGSSSILLNATYKHSLPSSCRCIHNPPLAGFQLTNFSASVFSVSTWVMKLSSTAVIVYASHPSYPLSPGYTIPGTSTWYRVRFSKWYDAYSDSKISRIESWDGAAWVKFGNDFIAGSGFPAAENFILAASPAVTLYWDDIEIYI